MKLIKWFGTIIGFILIALIDSLVMYNIIN